MSPPFSSATVISMDDHSRLEPLHACGPTPTIIRPRVFAYAVWHSLAWLVFANAVGVLIATFLLLPGLNKVFDTWTYGRWVPVHINLQLYGWCSLPLVAFLFKVYGADRNAVAAWCRPVLWVWSSALAIGALSWVTGHSSGKLFLDWTGYSRVLFPLALVALWVLLANALLRGWNALANVSILAHIMKLTGLALLLAVPLLLYIAASPNLYPPINPDTGGPTGASQLESTLVIIAILLLLPFGITHRKFVPSWAVVLSWSTFAAEAVLCLGLGRADVSHHLPVQYLSLGSLLVWIPLTPIYHGAFHWHPNTRRWRLAFLCWWSVLVPTGWMLFLPGVLDHFKFTDGLVGHSLLAMAGFVSSLLIFVMVQLLGDEGWIFNDTLSFYVWQASILIYVLIMFFAGWREGSDPAFSIVPSALRNNIYALRLLLGILILLASIDWFIDASKLLDETAPGYSYEPRGESQ
jgi:cytochrome c oxidase cbb3-type subunit 1